MNVGVVSCVYPPEPVVSGRVSADVAVALQSSGARVTVICSFPSRPHGRLHEGFRRRWHVRSVEPGIETVRCWSIISSSSTLLSRAMENISFGVSSTTALLGTRKLDAVYLNSWAIFATGLAALGARLKGIPYIISVQDVYPESLLVQNRAGGRIVAPLLRWIDKRIARGAAAVIVLSEAFASIYRDDRGVDPARIHIIPNWASEVGQASRDEALAYRRGRGIADNEFLVVYGGNVGVAAGVEQLVEAFRHVDSAAIRLLIAGGGARADFCQSLAQRVAPGRIQFHRPWHADETSRVLAAADLFALPTAGQQSQVSVPSKLISYLLSERPVLASVDGDSEIARILRQAGAGWIVEPGDAQQLAGAIVEASRAAKATRKEMGVRGRRYAESHFGREGCVARVLSIIRSAAR